ncbi:MAG: hypothetical protein ABIK92_13775 [Pseudomonadota bacterium]
MGFWGKIFGNKNNNDIKIVKNGTHHNWYFSEDKKRGLNQIVLNLDGRSATKSQFGNLILNRNKYGPLFSDLAVGFFDLDTNPGPFLLVKNSRYAKELANESITIAFTFCHMPSGPLFAIFMYPNSKQERLPPGACFTDQVYNINDFKDLITGSFKKDKMTIVFAQGGGMAGIDCLFDVEYIFNNSLHEKFIEQWSKLIEHGKSVRSISFEASREELYARTPTNESPILRLK